MKIVNEEYPNADNVINIVVIQKNGAVDVLEVNDRPYTVYTNYIHNEIIFCFDEDDVNEIKYTYYLHDLKCYLFVSPDEKGEMKFQNVDVDNN